MSIAEHFSAELKMAREGAGLSRRKLAFAVDADPSYVGLLESGKRTPSFEMIERLAAVLGVSPVFYFYRPTKAPKVRRVTGTR